jgi:UDP:flavonoid glycosyltransferase YjiC (YdhE family)
MARIAITVFGTAGDILPCIPVGVAMQQEGHEVTFVTPRWLGLLSRIAGMPTVSTGDGSEKQALSDKSMYTTRFDGMASWRHCLTQYVYPTLSKNYEAFLREIRRINPDKVVTTALGYWGPVAATELGIPWASLHLYPQLLERSLAEHRSSKVSLFARPLADWLRNAESHFDISPSLIPSLDWTVSRSTTVCGHDPAAVDFASIGVSSLGFPYWDLVYANSKDGQAAKEFLQGDESGRIVVNLGSFIGMIDFPFWSAMFEVAKGTTHRFLFVGVPETQRRSFAAANVLATSNVALSGLLPEADLFVHHGGIGTTYAGLNAGVPALVIPHAFDQPYNARMVARLGVGEILDRNPQRWRELIDRMLGDRQVRGRAAAFAAQLVPPQDAARNVARRLAESD